MKCDVEIKDVYVDRYDNLTRPCKKCGYPLSIVPQWEVFYCNHFCCSPCCPDARESPCQKERTTNELKEALKGL